MRHSLRLSCALARLFLMLACMAAVTFPAQTLAGDRYAVELGPKFETPAPGREVTVTDSETSEAYELTVLDSGEIRHGADTYRYDYTDEDQTVFYPDGNRCDNFLYGYLVDKSGSMLTSDEKGSYLPPRVLIRAIEAVEDAKWKPNGNAIFFGLVLLGLGLFTCLKPRLAHYLDVGWQYKSLEPSELNLSLRVLGGGIVAIAGLVFAIIGIVG